MAKDIADMIKEMVDGEDAPVKKTTIVIGKKKTLKSKPLADALKDLAKALAEEDFDLAAELFQKALDVCHGPDDDDDDDDDAKGY